MVFVVMIKELRVMTLCRLQVAYIPFLVDLSVTMDETEFNERVVSHDCSWLSMDT